MPGNPVSGSFDSILNGSFVENQEMNSNKYQDEEITLKELILKIKEYYLECKKNWKIILLFTIPFIGYQLFLRFTKPYSYPASLTFMINDTRGSSIGGVLGQFKSLVGENEEKLDKILALAKTRNTIARALFATHKIQGKDDYLANHLIRDQDFKKIWLKNKILDESFLFTRSNTDSFSLAENYALSTLHKCLIGNEDNNDALFNTSSNRRSEIMSLTLKTNSEELTISLLIAIYNSLSNFYIENAIRKEKESYEVLSDKRDSIGHLLFRNDYATAKQYDRSNALVLNIDKVPEKQFLRNNQVLTAMYTEIVKNVEIAEFSLKTATPYISIIDQPIPPLKPVKFGRLRNILTFLLIGMCAGVFIVVAKHIYKEIMSN